MAGTERIKEEIIAYLLLNRENILMDTQTKYCAPCGGMKSSKVYRNPDCGHLGRLLDALASKN